MNARVILLSVLICGLERSEAAAPPYRLVHRFPEGLTNVASFDVRYSLFERGRTNTVGSGVVTTIALTNGQLDLSLPLKTNLAARGRYSLKMEQVYRVGSGRAATNYLPELNVTVRHDGRLAVSTPWNLSSDRVFLVIGALGIICFCVGRFNTPPNQRSMTTAARYHSMQLCYTIIVLIVYVMIVSTPGLYAALADQPELPDWLRKVSAPLAVALVLTVFLPSIPKLAEWDAGLRRRLHVMAAIPSEARSLTSKLVQAEFAPADATMSRGIEECVRKEFAIEDLRRRRIDTVPYYLVKVSIVMQLLKDWSKDRRFQTLLTEIPNDLPALERKIEELEARTKAFFEFQREHPPASSRSAKMLAAMGSDCLRSWRFVHEEVLQFLSFALLRCEVTSRGRERRIEDFGFKVDFTASSFSFNELIFISLLCGLIPAVAFIVFGTGGSRGFGGKLSLALLIDLVYTGAVAFATFPKMKFSWAKRSGPDNIRDRPWLFYVLAACSAACFGLVVSTAMTFIGNGFDLRDALNELTHKYPYQILPYATTLGLSFCCDNVPGDGSQQAKVSLRWRECVVLGVVGMGLAVLIRLSLSQTVVPGDSIPPLGLLAGICGLLGAIQGYFVPSWFRSNPPIRSSHRNDRVEPGPLSRASEELGDHAPAAVSHAVAAEPAGHVDGSESQP